MSEYGFNRKLKNDRSSNTQMSLCIFMNSYMEVEISSTHSKTRL